MIRGFEHFEREVGGDGTLLKPERKPLWYNFTLEADHYGNKEQSLKNSVQYNRIRGEKLIRAETVYPLFHAQLVYYVYQNSP